MVVSDCLKVTFGFGMDPSNGPSDSTICAVAVSSIQARCEAAFLVSFSTKFGEP